MHVPIRSGFALPVFLIVLYTPLFSRSAEPTTSMLQFLQSRQDRRFAEVPREVLAFYYTWYGRPERHGRWVHWGTVRPESHEISQSTHYPAKGAYDSHDPEIVDWHIDRAKEHGVTGFIATWWGQGTFDDRAFVTLLQRAEQKKFKVTVYWETAPGEGQAQVDRAVNDLLYVLNRYGSSDAFLKVEDRPAIFVYGRVMNEVPLRSWPAIIQGVRQRYSGDFSLIADGYQKPYARVFDGVHTYNICSWVQGKQPHELRSLSSESFRDAVNLAKGHGKISCLTVIPGYDDTKIRAPGIDARRQDGQTYRVLWEEAIEADPDWVLITSWNEWHEGSEIEPSWEDGDRYLKITGEFASKFRASPHSRRVVPEPPRLDAEKAAELRQLYRGKAIGVLPDYGGDAVFWLADAGITLRELAWQDLLDAEKLRVEDVPLLLYASGEHYVRTVHSDGDVERALQRYLHDGGLLMALSYQPYPFFYDETGRGNIAAGRFGLPIVGSGPILRRSVETVKQSLHRWETPPTDAELTFHVDTDALAGVTAIAPFPPTGDQRWRPATDRLVAADDIYLPLAKLTDQHGNHYGDGIAYVEHGASQPRGGKCLYVWMRMPEVLGRDDSLYALFRLAAEKIGTEQ